MNDKHSRRVAATIQHSGAGYTTNCRAYVVAKIIFVLQGGWFANPAAPSQALFQDCAVIDLRVTVGVRVVISAIVNVYVIIRAIAQFLHTLI